MSDLIANRALGNALESLLRSDAWRAVEARIREKITSAVDEGFSIAAPPDVRAVQAGYWNGLRDALDIPGLMLEEIRRRDDG